MEKERLTPLVEAAKSKDADAFAEIYSSYYKSLYKSAYYLLGNPQDAEDTVMETVADAFSSIHKLRVAEAFEGWIFKILYNKARRKRGTTIYKATVELSENIESDDKSGDDIGDNVDLLRALGTLRDDERAVVVLSICEGYSSQDVSKIMGVNANTVRSKQMRALAKLRAFMEKE
ncbi:MAG: RNA polymerase sigma factor [Oscillospiraceae bacterium]